MTDVSNLTNLQRFLLDAAERAVKTFFQSAFAAWVALGNGDFDHLFTLDNLEAGVVGVAASFATSLASKKAGADDSASLLPEDVDPPQQPSTTGGAGGVGGVVTTSGTGGAGGAGTVTTIQPGKSAKKSPSKKAAAKRAANPARKKGTQP